MGRVKTSGKLGGVMVNMLAEHVKGVGLNSALMTTFFIFITARPQTLVFVTWILCRAVMAAG